jgi:hypothetical protein
LSSVVDKGVAVIVAQGNEGDDGNFICSLQKYIRFFDFFCNQE